MTREDDPRHVGRPDRRPQIGFGAAFIGYALMRHAKPVEIGLNPFDQRKVRVAARRVKADERFEDFDGPLRAHYRRVDVADQPAS